MSVEPVSVVFVCTGNICRSPTAAAAFARAVAVAGLSQRIRCDSAGLVSARVGQSADAHAVAAAARRGLDLSGHRARAFAAAEIRDTPYVVGMDRTHVRDLRAMCPPELRTRVRLLLEFAPTCGRADVPDPFGGRAADFELVLDLVELAVPGLLDEIVRTRGRG